MKIVGCDLHTRYQQIAMLDQETGELIERRLEHESGEARAFYAALSGPVRVGIEATGHTRWFERMLAELGSKCRVVATGGQARLLSEGSKYIRQIDDFLTLDGLRILWDRLRQ